MARSVYFAFDYEDVKSFRANVVRNSWVMSKYKFKDSSIWEESKEKTVKKIKEIIDDGLKGTSVTCVLIGTGTYDRRYVRYEIVKSLVIGKGLLGVGINWIKDKNGDTKLLPGNNPFEYLKVAISDDGSTLSFFEYKNGTWIPFHDLLTAKNKLFLNRKFGRSYSFNELFSVYSYEWNNGKKNLVDWVEKAAQNAGR